LKDKKNKIDDDVLTNIYDNCLSLLSKYKMTDQHITMRKLIFHLETIEKEREIVKMGINTFVYQDEVTHFIKDVADDVVKIIELHKYEREIPDDIAKIVNQVKDNFDEFYIVFTDYTGEAERQVQKERRDKDPILFGAFQDEVTSTVIDRFYFLGDWEDEYCDLTLDKMVNAVKAKEKRNIEHTIKKPEDIEELKTQLALLSRNPRNTSFIVSNEKKVSFFKKIKSFLTMHKK
jgi:hypothetical protein